MVHVNAILLFTQWTLIWNTLNYAVRKKEKYERKDPNERREANQDTNGRSTFKELISTQFVWFLHSPFLFLHLLFRPSPTVLLVLFWGQRHQVEIVVEFEPMPNLSFIHTWVGPLMFRLPCSAVIKPCKPFRVIHQQTWHVVYTHNSTPR